MLIRRLRDAVVRFHRDERGDVLQMIMITAFGAVLLSGVITIFWPQIKDWATDAINEVVKSKF